MEGLRRKPEFRAECDTALKDFLENQYKNEMDILKQYPERFGDPYKSPFVMQAFLNSRQGQSLGGRWGFTEALHYDCLDLQDFPLHMDYQTAYLDPKYDYLEKGKLLHIVVNLNATKKEILAWVGSYIDKLKRGHPRGVSISDTQRIFQIYDMRQEGKTLLQITREFHPHIKDKSPAIDPEAKSLYKNVLDAYRKAAKIIKSIKPID